MVFYYISGDWEAKCEALNRFFKDWGVVTE